MNAILLQADEVLVKPMPIPVLVATIREKLHNLKTRKGRNVERVAVILEREAAVTISEWLTRVESDGELTRLQLTSEQRTGHLPKLIEELVHRLRVPRSLGTKHVSEAAALHGKFRQSQGYSIPMIIGNHVSCRSAYSIHCSRI